LTNHFLVSLLEKSGHAAFTLAEVMIAVGVMSVVLMSVFAGILYGNTEIKLARENLRATQVVLEKMEGIRLYTFDQLVSSNMFATSFTAQYYPMANGNQSQGVTYFGNLSIADPATGTAYNSNMRMVTVSVIWTNQYGRQAIVRNRTMQTLVARNGIQNYSFYH
jgi:type II secretory pathway pseudopilin PulG